MREPDFRALQAAAYPEGEPGEVSDLEALWRALFDLESWVFLVHPRRIAEGQDPFPFIANVSGQGWLFVFTSTAEAAAFSEAQGLRSDDGSTYTLGMGPLAALGWMADALSDDVTTVHFNYGASGWSAPPSQVTIIAGHLGLTEG
ncbi:MAG: hypothetical protein RLZZ383_2868 [Pseudomonadota bacterium]|jgi:hypothetical protein